MKLQPKGVTAHHHKHKCGCQLDFVEEGRVCRLHSERHLSDAGSSGETAAGSSGRRNRGAESDDAEWTDV